MIGGSSLGQALILFIQFFTRINVPMMIDDVEEKFRRNIQYLTVFGLLLGILEAVIFWLLQLMLPVWLAWGLFLVSDGLLTGGFHLDALADSADGLFSSRTPDKMHEIMKDSRIGTMGTLALLYYYGIMIGGGVALSQQVTPLQLAFIAAITTMLAKTGLSLLFYKMVYAGAPHGLASIWVKVKTWQIVVAQLFSLVVMALALGLSGILSYLAILVVAYGYRRRIIHILGGFSGDTIGAFAELAQVTFLLAYLIFSRWLG